MTDKQTYKVWFRVVNEPKWCSASKEWDTEEEAKFYAVRTFRVWTATEDWCVTVTGVDPNNYMEKETA